MTDIAVKNVTYSYISHPNALEGVSLAIPPGGFYGIIGPNGSGKTTLLKCISGYLKPESGRVLVGGADVQSFPARKIAQKMALVQQHFALEYEFTVQDIVLTGRNPHLKRWQHEGESDYRIAEEAMRRTGILALKNRLVTELSGGEWQRMVLARALAQRADILLLDEPVSGLDIKHQVSFLSAARRLAFESKITVVCVLHDLNLARHYCDTTALLDNGHLSAVGKPETVLTRKHLEPVYGIRVNVFEKNGDTFVLPEYDEN